MIKDLAYPADQKADRQALCFIRLATGHAIKKKSVFGQMLGLLKST